MRRVRIWAADSKGLCGSTSSDTSYATNSSPSPCASNICEQHTTKLCPVGPRRGCRRRVRCRRSTGRAGRRWRACTGSPGLGVQRGREPPVDRRPAVVVHRLVSHDLRRQAERRRDRFHVVVQIEVRRGEVPRPAVGQIEDDDVEQAAAGREPAQPRSKRLGKHPVRLGADGEPVVEISRKRLARRVVGRHQPGNGTPR